jgi:hypothetical protein
MPTVKSGCDEDATKGSLELPRLAWLRARMRLSEPARTDMVAEATR